MHVHDKLMYLEEHIMKKLCTAMRRCLPFALIALLFVTVLPHPNEHWLQLKGEHYMILYQVNYEKDAEFARTWMDRTEQLMKAKYGVTPDHYQMSVYLFPAPASDINEACAN
jgi:hypothetical protein